MTGSDAYLPVMADCERGMGRPERALDLVRSPEAERLDRAERIELSIVESGARRDLGQHDAAVITLQRLPELRDPQPRPWSARLAFAYADALAEAGHQEAATDWFGRAMAFDEDGETDAAERYAELTGAVIEDVEEEFDYEDDFDDAGAASPVSVEDDEPDDAEALAEAGDLLASPPQDTVDAELEDLQEASADADDAPAETRDAGSVVADGESDGDAEESADADGATSEADSADTGTQPEPQDAEPQVAEPSEPQVAERDAEPQDTASEDTASEDTASEDTEGTAGSEPVKSGDSATVTGISPAFIEPDFGDDLDGRDEGAKRDE